jgi:hypothetical protein
MIYQNGTTITPKIKRFADKTHLHNLFIFNKSGICIFRLDLTESFKLEQDQLISSFFTALMTFTKEFLGNKIKTLEMAGVKFVIIEMDTVYYGLLCDSLENLMLLEDLISKIHVKFFEYVKENGINIFVQFVEDENLNEALLNVINDILSNEFDLHKEDKIIDYLTDFILNHDINGALLLTDKGKIIYSSLKRISLKNFVKEVDFRVKICNNNILKLFYTSKDNDIIFSEYVEDLYFVILIFDLNIKFGLAEYYLTKVVTFIKNTLRD